MIARGYQNFYYHHISFYQLISYFHEVSIAWYLQFQFQYYFIPFNIYLKTNLNFRYSLASKRYIYSIQFWVKELCEWVFSSIFKETFHTFLMTTSTFGILKNGLCFKCYFPIEYIKHYLSKPTTWHSILLIEWRNNCFEIKVKQQIKHEL